MNLSEDELGIPTRDLSLAATSLVAPVVKWGTIGRTRPMPGTYHFYTHDYKFTGLERRPYLLRDAGTAVAVEPNFSILPQMPTAQALWLTFRKRSLAAWFQHYGVRIVVDLNLDAVGRHLDVGLLGVPPGWAAYATRAHRNVPFGSIESAHQTAQDRAGRILDVWAVFGGGKRVKAACGQRGWSWIPEHMDVITKEPIHA